MGVASDLGFAVTQRDWCWVVAGIGAFAMSVEVVRVMAVIVGGVQ